MLEQNMTFIAIGAAILLLCYGYKQGWLDKFNSPKTPTIKDPTIKAETKKLSQLEVYLTDLKDQKAKIANVEKLMKNHLTEEK